MSEAKRVKLTKEAEEYKQEWNRMTPEERRNAIKTSALKVVDTFLAEPDLERTLYCYRGSIADWRVCQQTSVVVAIVEMI